MKIVASFVSTLLLAGLLVLAFGLSPNASRWGLVDEPPPEPAHLIVILEPVP